MNLLSRWLRSGLPITVLLFLWISMRTVSGYPSVSGTGFAESMTAFGFPLSWYAASEATSNAYKIALLPLVVDLLIYALVVVLLQWLIANRLARVASLSSRTSTAVSVSLWAAAAICTVAAVVIMTPDVHVNMTKVDAYFSGESATHRRSFVVGFLPQER